MIFSIVKQSLEIRLRFENPPKINADTECVAAIGILLRQYKLPLPEKSSSLNSMIQELREKTNGLFATDAMKKLENLVYIYEPKFPLDDEKYELMKYSYEQTEA